ncbi:hypothetical protein LXL04_037862 [Taraxacum kok-saghyz]
MQTKGI